MTESGGAGYITVKKFGTLLRGKNDFRIHITSFLLEYCYYTPATNFVKVATSF